jgi:alpha,alpha-trehalase
MHTIHTSDIVPVDLNAVMYKTEVIISKLCLIKGYLKLHELFKARSTRRYASINTLLWSSDKSCWADYNCLSKQLNQSFYVSNLSPLWVGMRPPRGTTTVKRILDNHADLFHKYDGGVPVSLIRTEQQWDLSNVWAPNQHAFIMMLLKRDRPAALHLARKFFNTVYVGWKRSGMIYEKYDVDKLGVRGSGGEYEVCTGFGWTNGVVLSIINIFKDELVTTAA